MNNGYSVSTAIRMGRHAQDELHIIHFPDGPGLGIEVDQAGLKKLRMA